MRRHLELRSYRAARLSVVSMVTTLLLTLSGCGIGEEPATEPLEASTGGLSTFPPAPETPDGEVSPEVAAALERLAPSFLAGKPALDALATVTASRDARLAWYVSDLLRFLQGGDEQDQLVEAFDGLTGVDPRGRPGFETSPWRTVTDLLIVWELPAAPGYRELKASLFLQVEPAWEPFFADADSDIDWRLVSWGGVLIDGRSEGDTQPCSNGCIPALDDPALTDAAGGAWYPDDAMVFGIVVGGEAVAFPKNIMEVHEMVNISVGGRRLGIPYCTLCGSAQAYLTDGIPGIDGRLVLRTSGLLSRSNKVMYDLTTSSVFDTFTGRALSGRLEDAEVTLEQVTVETSTWEAWKRAHPDTRIVAEDGGIGRDYPEDPLQGRDAAGPIFPIGDVDPRLPVQEQVVGVIAPDGQPVAFEAARVTEALGGGETVRAGGVELFTDGGGLRARAADGTELVAHQAFWFAWSQFHPDTLVWEG